MGVILINITPIILQAPREQELEADPLEGSNQGLLSSRSVLRQTENWVNFSMGTAFTEYLAPVEEYSQFLSSFRRMAE